MNSFLLGVHRNGCNTSRHGCKRSRPSTTKSLACFNKGTSSVKRTLWAIKLSARPAARQLQRAFHAAYETMRRRHECPGLLQTCFPASGPDPKRLAFTVPYMYGRNQPRRVIPILACSMGGTRAKSIARHQEFASSVDMEEVVHVCDTGTNHAIKRKYAVYGITHLNCRTLSSGQTTWPRGNCRLSRRKGYRVCGCAENVCAPATSLGTAAGSASQWR